MASNRVIYNASSLLYSIILVLSSCSVEPFFIFDLIRSISHLLATNEETPKDYSYSVIYSNVMKGVFFYSIVTVFLSTTMTFASYSSFRELITAISHHWKTFLASLVAAFTLPAMLRPPSRLSLFEAYFNLTLLHSLFVVYFSVKLVTLPMLKEKFGEVMEIPKGLLWKLIFWQIAFSVMQIGTSYLSKEAYKMQIVFEIACEVMHMIWLASTYEFMVFTVLVYENKKLTDDARIVTSIKELNL